MSKVFLVVMETKAHVRSKGSLVAASILAVGTAGSLIAGMTASFVYGMSFWEKHPVLGLAIGTPVLLAILLAAKLLDRGRNDCRNSEESFERLAIAVEQATEAIVITDVTGAIEYVNPAYERLTGFSREEAIGANPRISKSGVQGGEFYRALWDTITSGDVWAGQIVNSRKDGSHYRLDVTITPARSAAGDIINYVAVMRDITQETALEAQLQQARKLEAVGSLAAGIAHEINTPIQFVGDNVRFLSDAFGDLLACLRQTVEIAQICPPDARLGELLPRLQSKLKEADVDYLCDEIPKAVEQTLDGVNRVATIVRAMKDFSHPDSQEKTSADLNHALESTLTVARNELKYVADVVTDFEQDLPPIQCYPNDLNQVFLNILINAAHAIADVVGDGSQGKGTIAVTTRSEGDEVVVTIADTGAGIPEEIRSRVFDHFFTTKDVGRGTGQGLSIARSVIVDRHGGEINFESVLGKGTRFIIRLPLAAEQMEVEV